MSGLLQINVQEARGTIAIPADLDALAVVIACSSAGAGLSPFFLSGTAAIANRGYGDGVDTLCQIIEQNQSNGNAVPKVPAAMYTTPVTTTGSYGTIDVTGVSGTSVVTTHSATHPLGTYEARIKVIHGGTIAAAGITLQYSLDGGRTYSNTVALGTATTYTIPNSGIEFDFAAGTLVAADLVKCRTFGPAPSTADIDAAFVALATATADFAIVALDFDCTATIAAHVTSGLNALLAVGKRCVALIRTRIPAFETSETDAAWNTLIATDFASFTDSRIVKRAAYGLITDAMTNRQYLRSDFAQFCADVVRTPRALWPACPADPVTGVAGMSNVSLVDSTGATIGHDEGPRGASTGLSDPSLGNTFSCVQRLPNPATREAVFNTVPWVCFAPDDRVTTLMARRLANSIEREAVAAGIPKLGANEFFVSTGPSTGTLTVAAREGIQAATFQVLASEFGDEIGNATNADINTGLVQVQSAVTVSNGSLLGVSVDLAPEFGGFVLDLNFTLSIQF